VDIVQLSEIAVRIGNLAMALGPDLESLEINPLLCSRHIEALDALAVWRSSEVGT
jgi:hypothetical protein